MTWSHPMKILKPWWLPLLFLHHQGLALRLFRTKMDFVGLFTEIGVDLSGFSITAAAPLLPARSAAEELALSEAKGPALPAPMNPWPAPLVTNHSSPVTRHCLLLIATQAHSRQELTRWKQRASTPSNRNKIQSTQKPIPGVRKPREIPFRAPVTPLIQNRSLRVLKPVMVLR